MQVWLEVTILGQPHEQKIHRSTCASLATWSVEKDLNDFSQDGLLHCDERLCITCCRATRTIIIAWHEWDCQHYMRTFHFIPEQWLSRNRIPMCWFAGSCIYSGGSCSCQLFAFTPGRGWRCRHSLDELQNHDLPEMLNFGHVRGNDFLVAATKHIRSLQATGHKTLKAYEVLLKASHGHHNRF